MKTATNTALSPDAINRLTEIQSEMRNMCEPRYDEFHKLKIERGFATIVIPRKTRR